MKRPFAVIGFSMLSTFLIISKLSFNQTVAFFLMATVLFFLFLAIKKIRKNLFIMTVLLSAVIFSLSFMWTQEQYVRLIDGGNRRTVSGIICETPKVSDYSNSYVIKISGENYKIRYVCEHSKGFKQGEKVSGKVVVQNSKDSIDFFEDSLSSKVYFVCFESDECSITSTGEKDPIYYHAGVIKERFVNVISSYLPNENGALSKAMSIGDRSGIPDKTKTMFNYSGISHLLVVSGLHLSLWSLGVIKILQKNEKTRKFVVPVGIACLLGFIVITGLSVSVVRAGLMVGFALLGRAFRRDSDSINAIGLAVTIILLSNPFAAYSAALWLSVLSTMGILVLYEPIRKWLMSFAISKALEKNGLFNFIITSIAISFATAICTMPVFIMKFQIMPIATFISNILAVDVALLLMISTVFGVFSHLLGLPWLSNLLFWVVNVTGTFLGTVAERIGMSKYSTISVASPIFKYFLVFAIISVLIAYFLKKYNKNILKNTSVLLSIVFALITLFSVAQDYNSISIHTNCSNGNLVTLINHQGETALFGCPDKNQVRKISNILTSHNAKELDNIETLSSETPMSMSIESYLFTENCRFNEDSDKYKVKKTEYGTEIIYENVNLLLINDKPCEKCFEKTTNYDIIIVYMQNKEQDFNLEELLRDEDSILINIAEGQTVSIDCKWEKLYVTYN